MSQNSRRSAPTSLFQKTALILLGLILTVVILEIGLRWGGFVFTSIQEHRNRVSISQRGTYRILCLGESTTARQYSTFLEETLNERNIGIQFSVIDKGLPGIRTDAILSLLEANLDAYNPDMVITMMGINDGGEHMPRETLSDSKVINFLKSSRVYKLARLLWLHLVTKLQMLGWSKPIPRQATKDILAEEGFSEYDRMINQGNAYQEQCKFLEAEEAYKKAVEIDPENDKTYLKLGNFYRDKHSQFSKGDECYKKALALNPRSYEVHVELGNSYRKQDKFSEAEAAYKKAIELDPQADNAYLQLAFSYQRNHKTDEVEEAFKRTLEINPNNEKANVALGDFYFKLGKAHNDKTKYLEAEKRYAKAIEVDPQNYDNYNRLGKLYREQRKHSETVELFKKFIERLPNNPCGYGALVVAYEAMNNPELAAQYSRKANELRAKPYDSNTASNYHKLKEILEKRGITYVCVQYPMREAGSLKKIFEGDADGIIFVDNERIFKDAVQKEGHGAHFEDMFAGDFGHCTPKGNRILAENIADTILREVFKQ